MIKENNENKTTYEDLPYIPMDTAVKPAMSSFKKLDVGCGNIGQGDVNCDLYIKDAGHRGNKLQEEQINPKLILNFVNCDALHLPFKNNVFEEVYSSHLIEHVSNPSLLIKEMLRVTTHSVIIKCPHRFGEPFRARYSKYHKWHFTRKDFAHLSNVSGYISGWAYLPHDYFPLFRLPSEITIQIIKERV